MFMRSLQNHQFGTFEKICQRLQLAKCSALALNLGSSSFTGALWVKMPCQPSATSSPGSHISRSLQVLGENAASPPRAEHYDYSGVRERGREREEDEQSLTDKSTGSQRR